MLSSNIQMILVVIALFTHFCRIECLAEELLLATVEVRETSGIGRELEYVDCSLQLPWHWAPNFQNRDYVNYETIAAWDNPENYALDTGTYLIQTIRRDQAPKHPEILLTATHCFYSRLPYYHQSP